MLSGVDDTSFTHPIKLNGFSPLYRHSMSEKVLVFILSDYISPFLTLVNIPFTYVL